MFNLGKEHNQESIIISEKGHVNLVYTSGPRTGYCHQGHGIRKYADFTNFSIVVFDDNDFIVIGQYDLDTNKLIDFTSLCKL